MKAMLLPFEELQRKGIFDFTSATSFSVSQQSQNWNTQKENCYVGTEPTSILDSTRSPIFPTSTTMSSSTGGNGGGAGSTDTTVGAGASVQENLTTVEKYGIGMEDWESVLSGSPCQEQSIMRLIMGDMEDPSMGLNKLLQSGSVSQQDLELNGIFGVGDRSFPFEPNNDPSLQDSGLPVSEFHFQNQNMHISNERNPIFSASATNSLTAALGPGMFQHQQQQLLEGVDDKLQVLNTQMLLNQNQAHFTQNPAMFMPLTCAQLQEHHLPSQPQAKRFNSGHTGPNGQVPKLVPFLDSGQELFARGNQQVQFVPHHQLQQRPVVATTKQKMVSDEMMDQQQLQQVIIDQLFKASELIEACNMVLAQGILARLNHHLVPIGKPFIRASFYVKEALQMLLPMNTSNSSALSPFNLIFKTGAYKSFSETSPVLKFANFTCNQAFLEALDGSDRIHIIDFDVGFGVQWASLMQELDLRSEGALFLKITIISSPTIQDDLELGFTRENLKHFATDLNIAFELEVHSIESLNSGCWPLPHHVTENEAIAVNLPISSFLNYPMPLPLVLRLVKNLSPKIVVSLHRGCDQTDAPFPHYVINALQSYSSLIESLDVVNLNSDTQQNIEKYLFQPGIEKMVSGRHCLAEITAPWRTVFLSSGLSPLTFSNFTESQADCLVQRTPVQGFHIEKRQASLVLCWQRKELVSVSAWRC